MFFFLFCIFVKTNKPSIPPFQRKTKNNRLDPIYPDHHHQQKRRQILPFASQVRRRKKESIKIENDNKRII